MIALFHWIARILRKDFKFLSRYERSHPHFFYLLGIDVLVSIAVVVLGFQMFAGSSDSIERALEKTGQVGLTVDQLIDRIQKDNHPVYWLGARDGDTYSIDHSKEYVVIITYRLKGRGVSDSRAEVTVETYESALAFDQHLRASVNLDSHVVVADKGSTVAYDSKSLMIMTLTMPRSPQVIVVSYPTKQTATSLLDDASKLTAVK